MEMQTLKSVDLLKAEFSRRCRANPKYSLRAFAKAMGISHTLISLIFAGKRSITAKTAMQLSDRLGWSPAQRKRLEGHDLKMTLNGDSGFSTMDLDQFEVIADWHHYAILSLLEVPRSKFDAKWIANRLGINPLEAQYAMERLQRLGLVAFSRGRWRQTGKSIKVENNISTPATRRFHRQLLERAIQSLENDPISTRDFSSITFAMDASQVQYALERIRRFRRDLCKELEERAEPNEVYQLMVQIFPLSRNAKGE
jgi:uncharacterized protein (TIGR02147 family)